MARPDEHLADVVDPSVKRHEDLRRGRKAQGSQLGSQQRRSREGPQGLALGRGANGGGVEAGQAARMRLNQYQVQSDQAELFARNGQHDQARAMSARIRRSRPAPCLAPIVEMLMTGLGRVSVRAISLGKENVRISGE